MTVEQTTPQSGFFAGALSQGLDFLSAYGQSRLDDRETEQQQTLLAGQAAANTSKTVWYVAAVAGAAVIAFIVWRMFRK